MPDGKKSTPAKSNSTTAKKYIGPDYKRGLLIGNTKHQPKDWNQAKIEAMIATDKRLAKYFA